jgi:hypothetical protein
MKFKVGDSVWLLRRNVNTTRPCEKLQEYQRLGPFVIVDQVNDVAFHLDLPSHMHIHPVFQMSLLEPWTSSSIPGRVITLSMKLKLSWTRRSCATSYTILSIG